jgi:calcium/calmodulin-dependent protein kinase I
LLYGSRDSSALLKISDFGLARFVIGELATTACGTPGYVAPEILEGKGYGKEVDYWSIGVILYILLCGFPPFYEENNSKLFEMIKNCEFEFPSPFWDDVSDEAKNLIKAILVRDPSQRLSAENILVHPWVNGDKASRNVLKDVTENMRQYNIKRRFKVISYSVNTFIENHLHGHGSSQVSEHFKEEVI